MKRRAKSGRVVPKWLRAARYAAAQELRAIDEMISAADLPSGCTAPALDVHGAERDLLVWTLGVCPGCAERLLTNAAVHVDSVTVRAKAPGKRARR